MMMAIPVESALVLVFPEAEPAVGAHRAHFDPAARVGVPAHITVAYPFAPVDTLATGGLDRLREVFRTAAPFTIHLDATGWFGEDVLFLTPRDSTAIIELTRRVEAAFPAYPIYGGQFEDIHPHLTIGQGCGAQTLRGIEEDVTPALPITHEATTVELWSGPAVATQQPSWQLLEAFPLGE